MVVCRAPWQRRGFFAGHQMSRIHRNLRQAASSLLPQTHVLAPHTALMGSNAHPTRLQLEEAVSQSEAEGGAQSLAHALLLCNLAAACTVCADRAGIVTAAQKALTILQSLDYSPDVVSVEFYCRMFLGRSLHEAGRVTEAIAVNEKAAALGDSLGNTDIEAVNAVYMNLVSNYHLVGRFEDAL